MSRFAKPTLRALLPIAAATAFAAISTAAQATSFRLIGESRGTLNGGPCQVFDTTSSVPVAATGGCFDSAAGQSSAFAGATFGQLAVGSQSSTGPFSNGFSARYDTTAEFRDFVTFSSTDPTVTAVSVSANLLLAGVLGVPPTFLFSGFESAGQFGGRQFQLNFNSNGPSSLFNQGIQFVGGDPFGSGTPTSSWRTDPITVNLNTPIAFNLRITVMSLAVNANARGLAEFGSALRPFASVLSDNGLGTLSGDGGFGVPIGVEAFVLPNGVTANSGTWLVNNQRIAAVVPEPATWALMLGGFGLLGLLGLRRRSLRSSQ